MENESTVVITTNHHARDLLSFNDLPADARADFDYIDTGDSGDQYSLRFVRYRGSWYDVYEFERMVTTDQAGNSAFTHYIDPDSPFAGWHGVQTQSYFDAILMKYARQWDGSIDHDAVVVAHATW